MNWSRWDVKGLGKSAWCIDTAPAVQGWQGIKEVGEEKSCAGMSGHVLLRSLHGPWGHHHFLTLFFPVISPFPTHISSILQPPDLPEFALPCPQREVFPPCSSASGGWRTLAHGVCERVLAGKGRETITWSFSSVLSSTDSTGENFEDFNSLLPGKSSL